MDSKKVTMMNILRGIIVAAALGIILGVAFWGVYSFFEVSFRYTDGDAQLQVVAAFAGAFFAFLFVRLAEFSKQIYDRRRRDRTALVATERLLNRIMGIIDRNQQSGDNLLECLQFSRTNDVIRLSMYKPHKIPTIGDDIIGEFTNIDIVNRIFRLNSQIERMNSSLNTILEMNNKIVKYCESESFSPDGFAVKAGELAKSVQLLRAFLDELFESNFEELARVRAILRCQSTLHRFLSRLVTREYPRNFSARFDQERELLRKEVARISQQDQERIDTVIKSSEIRAP